MSKPFRFKQFQVYDHFSTMKVGTDAVLLGAWANPPPSGNILDLGTGSGVIALMMAQKSHAHITAIDIHEPSIRQATENFEASAWKKNLTAIHTSISEITYSHRHFFDFIISNPPFFLNSLKPKKQNLLIAKHTESGFIDVFLNSLALLLIPQGRAAFIVTPPVFEIITDISAGFNIFPSRIANILSKPGLMPVRVMIEISKQQQVQLSEETICIRDENQQYTEAYIKLTQDFYLFLHE